MAPPIPNHWSTDQEHIDLLNYLIKTTENVESPMNMQQMAREFKEKSGTAQEKECLRLRIFRLRARIRSFDNIDTNTKVKLLFALSAPVDAAFLKKLKKDAVVEVDNKKRIIHYQATDGSLELKGDHSLSAKQKNSQFESIRCHRSMINNYFRNKNDPNAVPKNEEEGELWNLMEFITEKCENVNSPLSIRQLVKDFIQHFGISQSFDCIRERFRRYCRLIQKADFLDTQTKVKHLFGLSVKLDSDNLKELQKNAFVEVDENNRIIKYTANNGSLTLRGSHWRSKKTEPRRVAKKEEKNVVAMSDKSEEDSDSEGLNDDGDENSSEESGSECNSNDENDHLDETDNHMDLSNEADDFDNETPVRNRSPTEMSFDNDFDFDLPTERSHRSEETELNKDEGSDSGITENAAIKTRKFSIATLPKSNTTSTSSHTPKTPKRKAAPSESNSTKRTKPSSDESMNEGFAIPEGIEKDSENLKNSEPRPQIMDAPIKKEYEEEAHTSLKMVLNGFKSLILGLDTPGLLQLQMELDKRIMEAGRRSEVSNKEIILAMDLLIVKLNKHGSPKSSEDSISLRDILLMLRMIILNPSFTGLEGILEMLKENIEQLKVLDKRVPVSKVECVLRTTLDNISN